MKKILSLCAVIMMVLVCVGCGNTEEKCSTSFDCVKIEDNSYRCNYCSDGSKTCSNPKGVTCSSSND